MPVQGIASSDINDLRFSWRSARFFYTVFCALVMFVYSCYVAVWAFDGSLDFPRYGTSFHLEDFLPSGTLLNYPPVSLLFNVTNMVALLEFIRIAHHWPRLMLLWRAMEMRIQVMNSKFHYRPPGMSLRRKVAIFTALVLSLSVLEHILSLLTMISFVERCATGNDSTYEIFARQFQPLKPTPYDYIPKSILGRFCLTVSTFLWSYSDLFIILISVALTRNMRCFNRCLAFSKYKHLSDAEWEDNRNLFVMFSELCASLDLVVCKLTLVSFSNDIFFICVQLLNSLK